jgi:hypothetical protein
MSHPRGPISLIISQDGAIGRQVSVGEARSERRHTSSGPHCRRISLTPERFGALHHQPLLPIQRNDSLRPVSSPPRHADMHLIVLALLPWK